MPAVPKPDLYVTSVSAPSQSLAGVSYTVSWTVGNKGHGPGNGSWSDEVWLTDNPNVAPSASNALWLGLVTHEGGLDKGATYTGTLTVTLTPSARGQYIVIKTDAPNSVIEEDDSNNLNSGTTQVTPVPADLVVTSVVTLPDNRSGELTTIQYTVQNQGSNPVWPGTSYWQDDIWISADSSFLLNRASWFGKSIRSNAQPLQPGESYTVTVTAALPKGIGGNLFVYIHPDTHQDYSSYRTVQTGWWPAEVGRNDILLDHFSRWAFEDPTNNVYRAPIHVTYYEPDLVISNLQAPTPDLSGQTIDVTYTVTNEGTRDTREKAWIDRIFLSKDPSLDRFDLFLGEFKRTAALAIGDSYTGTVTVRMPDGIDGPFYLLALTDSPAGTDRGVQSDIGFGNFGVGFESPYSLGTGDRLQEAARLLARGTRQ